MCRLLLVENPLGFDPAVHLEAFRLLSRQSREFQGHGWGCAWLGPDRKWKQYHNIQPVWEDHTSFPSTPLFIAHARSAFRDEGITIENNMPFTDGENMFVFNGELQGVKIKAEGRIGAEKIFNTVKRFYRGDYAEATRRAVMVINRRTRYVRAMNFFLASSGEVQICSQFAQEPDYFQLSRAEAGDTRIICSRSYAFDDAHWQPVDNNCVYTLNLVN
jgi:glutamine amidotransferase